MRLLKIGGNELNNKSFLTNLAQAVAQMGEPVIIVHGGGQAIADLHEALNVPTVKIDGLRVTNERSLEIAEMVLSGQTNKWIVRALIEAGVDALGFSGVDGKLLSAKKKLHPSADLGYVGEIVEVRAQLLRDLLALGLTPVISPISLGIDGNPYNVNADEAAMAIAASLKVDGLDFISNVPGVLRDGVLIPALTTIEAEVLIANKTISGGMIPKVRSALDAIANGVTHARIVNLAGLTQMSGTTFSA